MEMEDQYGIADLRNYINGRTHFPAVPPPGDVLSIHRNLTQAARHHHDYEMVMLGRHQMGADMGLVPRGRLQQQHQNQHHEFRSDSTNTASVTEAEAGGGGLGGDGTGTGRWPRQETLTLLEIRSRLDSKFKEANQKGPLWDEISRIMSEEHGYQRSGKKCREKFENLYKYYKKTKEGKAGRQDGKHYRFFRQLEALYGDTGHPVSVSETHLVGNSFRFHNTTNFTAQSNQESFQAPKLCDSLSLSNSSEFDTSSSDGNDDANAAGIIDDDSMGKKKIRRDKRSWKAKIRDFIDSQMRKLMEKQEEWLEKMMKTLERKEEERMMREEEWRKQETDRVEREHQFWANERAWIEARDVALMEALRKLTEKEGKASSSSPGAAELQTLCENPNENALKLGSWPECEITNLIHLRSSMESRFQQSGCSEEVLWEEIAAKMACFGCNRSALMCKNKWKSINTYLRKTMEMQKKKKLKENSRSCSYFQNNESVYNQGGTYSEIGGNDGGSPLPPNAAAAGSAMNDSCFRFLVGTDHGENLWESYGVRMGKRENQSSG